MNGARSSSLSPSLRSEHDRQKEKERSELVQMILESIANVPVAIERIHTNEKLRNALREEMGEEHDLLHRIFGGNETTTERSHEEAWSESFEQSSGVCEEADDKIVLSPQRTEEDDEADEADDEDSIYGSGYEEDLAQAVNQLVMSEGSLNSIVRQISAPIMINDGEMTNTRMSSSPNSSYSFGASPGTCSQDGEPVSALWPRQPHQFAFTQEEEGTVRGEDEVYSEVVGSMCEDESLGGDEEDEEEDEDDFDGMDKVFNMDEDEEELELSERLSSFSQKKAIYNDLKRLNHAFRAHGVQDEEDAGDVDEDIVDQDENELQESQDKYDIVNLRIIRQKDRTGFEPDKDLIPRVGNIVAGRYKVELAIGEAVFSRTYKCIDLQTNQRVCLKIIKNNKEYFDQGIDEIRVLEYIAKHCDVDKTHLVRMLDYFYFREHLIIVTELLRDNLYEFSRLLAERGVINYFNIPRLKKITVEVLQALNVLHNLGLVHCDLKPENILIQSFSECTIKVIDFGSACFITDELTSYVQSRSYRAPEVILGLQYDQKIDLWSLGCVLAELFTGEVLFKNDSEQTLLARIIATIGPIPSHLFEGNADLLDQFRENSLFAIDPNGNGILSSTLAEPPLEDIIDTEDQHLPSFLRSLLEIDPQHRASAAEALAHPWLARGVFQTATST